MKTPEQWADRYFEILTAGVWTRYRTSSPTDDLIRSAVIKLATEIQADATASPGLAPPPIHKPCPRCGAQGMAHNKDSDFWFIECVNSRPCFRTNICITEDAAWKIWDERHPIDC